MSKRKSATREAIPKSFVDNIEKIATLDKGEKGQAGLKEFKEAVKEYNEIAATADKKGVNLKEFTQKVQQGMGLRTQKDATNSVNGAERVDALIKNVAKEKEAIAQVKKEIVNLKNEKNTVEKSNIGSMDKDIKVTNIDKDIKIKGLKAQTKVSKPLSYLTQVIKENTNEIKKATQEIAKTRSASVAVKKEIAGERSFSAVVKIDIKGNQPTPQEVKEIMSKAFKEVSANTQKGVRLEFKPQNGEITKVRDISGKNFEELRKEYGPAAKANFEKGLVAAIKDRANAKQEPQKTQVKFKEEVSRPFNVDVNGDKANMAKARSMVDADTAKSLSGVKFSTNQSKTGPTVTQGPSKARAQSQGLQK